MTQGPRYTLISSDCHAGAPWFVYREYLDPEFRDEWDRYVLAYYGSKLSQQDLDNTVNEFVSERSTPQRQKEYLEAVGRSMGHLGNWDPAVRAKELDREGIAGEVVFCDGSQRNHPPFGVGFATLPKNPRSYAERRAGCMAHNRWLVDLCNANKGRHAGVALITMDNPEDTVEDIRWAKKNNLFGGVMLPSLLLGTDGPESFWHHPRYEPVWRECEELEMPLNTHVASAGPDYGDWLPIIIKGAENSFVTFRPFSFLLWGGVFERHPRLNLCMTESGGMIGRWLLPYFDHYIAKTHPPANLAKAISMPPSEYWYRQCFVGASANASRAEIDARNELGVKNIMWGSDYPHPEGTWPASTERTAELFKGVPTDEVRLMIGGNAGRVYKFDMAQMDKIAERIGPTVAEVSGA